MSRYAWGSATEAADRSVWQMRHPQQCERCTAQLDLKAVYTEDRVAFRVRDPDGPMLFRRFQLQFHTCEVAQAFVQEIQVR